MNAITPSAGLTRVRALYRSLAEDRDFPATAPPADPALSAGIAAALAHEARLLDQRQFARWLGLWEPDAVYWVPLTPDGDPAGDQALFLDDHRRLKERVWRMGDASAWAIQPPGDAIRLVGGVEAWPLESPDEVIAVSAITLHYTRLQAVFTTAGRQVHRLRRGPEGWRLSRKILLLPALAAGTPHLGWLL